MNPQRRRHHNKILHEDRSVTKVYESNEGFERELLAYELLAANNLPLTIIFYCINF